MNENTTYIEIEVVCRDYSERDELNHAERSERHCIDADSETQRVQSHKSDTDKHSENCKFPS